MRKLLILLLGAGLLMASECTYRVKNIDVGWEAFKTPLKIGVGGGFKAIKLSAKPNTTLDGLLRGAKVSIDTSSVDSGNHGRNAKLVKAFFGAQHVDKIEAVIDQIVNGIAQVKVTMNGISRIVPMKMEQDENGRIDAQGVLDLADFKMLPALKSINKACYDLHKGKTWQDVKITFKLETKKRCP